MATSPLLRCVALFLTLGLASCAAPSRPGDPKIATRPARTDFAAASEVRLHRFSAKGARIPDAAFAAAIVTIEKRLHRPIRIIDHGEFQSGWGDGGQLAPIHEDGRPVSAAQVVAAPNHAYRFAQPDDGILGLTLYMDVSNSKLEPSELAQRVPVIPLLEPGTLIVVEFPGSPDGRGITGRASRVAIDGLKGIDRCTGIAILYRSAIRRNSNLFVSESKLAQWTLTHELGHVLGVPASNTHAWTVSNLGDHCTNPACLMYTGFDWRVLWTGLVKGWPMDFCKQCAAEIEAANPSERERSSGAGE